MLSKSQVPWYMAHSTYLNVSPTEYLCKQHKKFFSLHKHHLSLSNQHICLKILICDQKHYHVCWVPFSCESYPKSPEIKLESGPSAKAARGSCYKIVASLIWMSKKNDRNSGFFLISRELPRRRWRAKKSTCLLGGSSWRGEAKNLLDVLSNWHGTENIQEDEGTVCGVISQQISMRQSLDVGKGVKGSFATTLPSNMELNIPIRAVKQKPIANMDFIRTIDRSLLLFFSFSSCLSIFFFCCRPADSVIVSFFFSNFLLCFSTSAFSLLYLSVL